MHKPAHASFGGERHEVGARLYIHRVERGGICGDLEVQAGQVKDGIHAFQQRPYGTAITDIHLMGSHLTFPSKFA
jgi:hypothetical protein